MGPSYQEVGDVRDTLLNMALWFQILLLVSHARTVKCLSLLASSPLRPTALFCSAPPSPWLCPPLAVKFEGAGASGSSSAKQGSWPCKLMYGTIETHYDLFLLPSLYQLGPFGSQTEDSTQNGLGKMRMCCSSTISRQQKKKKKFRSKSGDGSFPRTGFLSGTWLFPWCWVRLQTLLMIPSPGGKMATVLIHIPSYSKSSSPKGLEYIFEQYSLWPKFGQPSPLKHFRQRHMRFGLLGWGRVHLQSWR